jgi:hypothetical protein
LFPVIEEETRFLDEITPEPISRKSKRKRNGKGNISDIPKDVKPVTRLSDDLYALHRFFNVDIPPDRLVRGKSIFVVWYGFGDALKAGFGASWEGADEINHRSGTWDRDTANESSSLRDLEREGERKHMRRMMWPKQMLHNRSLCTEERQATSPWLPPAQDRTNNLTIAMFYQISWNYQYLQRFENFCIHTVL